jgi:hypothetical protein
MRHTVGICNPAVTFRITGHTVSVNRPLLQTERGDWYPNDPKRQSIVPQVTLRLTTFTHYY